MSRQQDYCKYRERFVRFVYHSYHYDVQPEGLHIGFCFNVESADNSHNIAFNPSAFIPSRSFLHPDALSKQTLDSLVFHIGMIELISYWKTYCPPTVAIRPFNLNEDQIRFWKKLYFNGLGEFFYTNGISASIDDFMSIESHASCVVPPISDNLFDGSDIASLCSSDSTHIVPIGGGKDSVVTLELLTAAGHPLPLIMNPRGATTECVAKAGFTLDDVIVIERKLDQQMLRENSQGALNGHTPFSAMLAFYTLLASALTLSRRRIALSNENSANESTVVGSSVNHQYSKSIEFENDFRGYVASYISRQFDYYSFLRPLSELQIAMLFARNEKYFDVFKSCNVGSKQDIWCGHCAKCLFAFIILSPFIEPKRLERIFGKNMLDDSSLLLEFEQLTGHKETKPFECVGTVDEVNSALSMAIDKWYASDRPALLKNYIPTPSVTPLDSFCSDNNLPPDDASLLSHTIDVVCGKRGEAPDFFRCQQLAELLNNRTILIAGYGREGKSTHALLNRLFPGRYFDIARNDDEIVSALKRKKYDLVLKSPGIPLSLIDGLCDRNSISSQSDLFLQVYGDLTVGVTGTKGKSTTTSLIFKSLSDNLDNHVILAGNIGIPLLDIVNQLDEKSIVVAELSCHQLEIIHKSAHIGVILNLFEEHLDHYRNYDGYCEAKMQLALKQNKGDKCFFCRDNDDLDKRMNSSRQLMAGEIVSYGKDDANAASFLSRNELPLAGEHNLCNIYVAWLVSDCFGVDKDAFVSSVMSFKPLSHRLERVDSVRGVTYYDDSISTIPQATIAAVEALKDVSTLILGGFDRGIDYTPLAEYLETNANGRKVLNIVLFGSAGKAILDAIECFGSSVNRNIVKDFGIDYSMENAVAFAAKVTPAGKICLLSPAASSYDHYKNFEYRGDHFKACVRKLL